MPTARGKARAKVAKRVAGKKGAKTGSRRAAFKKLSSRAKRAAFSHMDATSEKSRSGIKAGKKRKAAAVKRRK